MDSKNTLLLLAAAAALALTGALPVPASAQPWVTVSEREQRLNDRIAAGVHTGQLNNAEAARLQADFRRIADLENTYRRNGLSAWERADLDRRFNALTSRIHDERHDAQVASAAPAGWFGGVGWTDNHGVWMSINARQDELHRRIDRGVRQGRLSPREALRLRTQFDRIARREARYRQGGLSQWEQADLDRRFDQLASHVRWQSYDSEFGYGYRH